MPYGQAFGVVDLMRWVAYAALVVYALLVPPNARALVAISATTSAMWLFEFLSARRGNEERPDHSEVRLIGLILAVCLFANSGAAIFVMSAHTPTWLGWFGTAAVIAVLALLSTRLRSPQDLVLLTILSHQAVAAIPALVLPFWFAWSRVSEPRGIGELDSPVKVLWLAHSIVLLFLPLVCAVALLAALVEAIQPRSPGARMWQVVCVAIGIWSLLAVRLHAGF